MTAGTSAFFGSMCCEAMLSPSWHVTQTGGSCICMTLALCLSMKASNQFIAALQIEPCFCAMATKRSVASHVPPVNLDTCSSHDSVCVFLYTQFLVQRRPAGPKKQVPCLRHGSG
eukprot:jgi/Ulvmu1/8315/UM042_0021.1